MSVFIWHELIELFVSDLMTVNSHSIQTINSLMIIPEIRRTRKITGYLCGSGGNIFAIMWLVFITATESWSGFLWPSIYSYEHVHS